MSLGPAVDTAAAATSQTPPSITTNAWDGQTLVVTQGTYNGLLPVTISDEWFRCTDPQGTSCTDTGISGPSYPVTNADDTFHMKVTETATDGVSPTTADSNVTFAVQPQAPTSVTPPSVADTTSDTSTVDQSDTLTAADGTWSEPQDSVLRQWDRCDASSCSAIAGETNSTYVTTRADVGDTIEIIEMPVYGPTTLSAVASPQTAGVVGTPAMNSTPPSLSGQAIEGQTLTATTGSWTNTPDSYAYRWQRCDSSCQPIPGATNSTYVLTAADVGHTVDVEVTAIVGTTPSLPTQSAQTAGVLPLPPSNTSAPTVSGTPAEGQTFTAGPGTWTDSPTSYTYQWQDCDGSGANCAAIGGATASTYTTVAGDVGHTLVVNVSGVNAGGTGAAASSAPSGQVQTSSASSVTNSPSAGVANQSVTLTASVTPHAAGARASGTVRFADHGNAIDGCAAQPVSVSGQGATATCQTTFAAGVRLISAAFNPNASSPVSGSISPVDRTFISRDATTTALDVSSNVKVGAHTTFTATLARQGGLAGTLAPTGTVEFMDFGKPIAGCAKRPVLRGGATCAVAYTGPGLHSIRARFGGDPNFQSSSSAIKALKVTALPIRGTITATMQWTFRFTPAYTEVMAMVVNGVPRGGVVRVSCTGKGCPFAKRSTAIGKPNRCTKKPKSACPPSGQIVLTGALRHHRLGPGAQITIVIERPQFIGKYYSFLIRSGREPRVTIACLGAGGSKPGAGC